MERRKRLVRIKKGIGIWIEKDPTVSLREYSEDKEFVYEIGEIHLKEKGDTISSMNGMYWWHYLAEIVNENGKEINYIHVGHSVFTPAAKRTFLIYLQDSILTFLEEKIISRFLR